MGAGDELTTRRLDYRLAPDEDLAKLHLVESEVEAERRPDKAPTPFDRFLVAARAFPAYFQEWSYLFEAAADGEPVGTGALWYRQGADPNWLELDAWVRRPWRRRGLGTQLLRTACDVADEERRTKLVASTTDKAPSGEAFLRRFGFEAARVSRRGELVLAQVDWAMVRHWIEAGPVRAPGYSLELVEGAYPRDRWEDAVALRRIMNTAPQDDLAMAPRDYTAEQVPQDDAWLLNAGQQRWTLFARHDATATCVGATTVFFSPSSPDAVDQGDTGVHPEHRGHALGKWLKAAMLERIRDELPQASLVHTGNAFSNAPMLAINDALGFRVIRSTTDWAAEVATVRDRLRRGGGRGE